MKPLIKVRFAWPAVPVVFVSVNALPFGWIATCLGLLVLVRTSHFQDEPTAAHELEHCRQTIKGLALIHFIRYHASARYRLRCEAKAFAAIRNLSGDLEAQKKALGLRFQSW